MGTKLSYVLRDDSKPDRNNLFFKNSDFFVILLLLKAGSNYILYIIFLL